MLGCFARQRVAGAGGGCATAAQHTRMACWIATVSVPLAGALEDFFTRNGLPLPPGHDEDRANRRRLQAIPARCGQQPQLPA
jgi:hypothetical protein